MIWHLRVITIEIWFDVQVSQREFGASLHDTRQYFIMLIRPLDTVTISPLFTTPLAWENSCRRSTVRETFNLSQTN